MRLCEIGPDGLLIDLAQSLGLNRLADGYGVFAGESINKNTRIIDYAGELIRNRDSAPREIKCCFSRFTASAGEPK